MTQVLHLLETAHPNERSRRDFETLLGIDSIKQDLLRALLFMLAPQKVDRWIEQHHPNSGHFLKDFIGTQKLAILAGDVGCGKTMLANSIATPLAEELDAKFFCFESPTNVRGQGMVGELSARITSLFDQAKSKLSNGRYGILIIDEADDLATSRAQMQAHHEDRAGVNVLARQIDSLSKEPIKLAVILISNRLSVLDPAILRRSAITLHFERPNAEIRRTLFIHLFEKLGVRLLDSEITALVEITEQNSVSFTYSDILKRGLKTALVKAIERKQPLTSVLLKEVLTDLKPTPKLESEG